MRLISRSRGLAAGFALLAVLAMVGYAGVGARAEASADYGAVYTMTNAADGNQVMAWYRGADGKLSDPHSYATGGNGAGTGLGSQGAVTLSPDGDWLFAVNAGSNTVSVFKVLPYSLKLVGAFGSNGEHPISVASHGDLVYVLNTGGTGNITGFSIDTDGWLWPIGWSTESLGVSYPASAEQVGFSPNGRFLVVTLKDGNGIVTYVLNPNGTSDGPTLTDSVVPAPYAFGFDDAGRLLVANAASSSVASYNIFPNGTIENVDLLGDNQKAACWIVVTSDGAYLYTANAGSGNVSGFKVTVEGELGLIGKDGIAATTEGKPLDLDLSDGDGYLYVLNAATGKVDAFRTFWDGSLAAVSGGVEGLPAGTTGLAAR